MTSSNVPDEAEVRALCQSITSKLAVIEKINFEDQELAESLPEEDFENLLVGIGMAEAYLAGAIAIHSKGLETLKKADELASAWIREKEDQA